MNSKELHLLRSLLEATQAGRVIWTPGDGINENEQVLSYQGRAGGARVYPRDWDNFPPYVLEILDAGGAKLANWSTESLDPVEAQILSDVYEVARTSAASSVIDSLLKELDAPEDEPF